MDLQEHFEKTGNKLFRWRSYLPLALVALMFIPMINYRYILNSQRYDYIWEAFCLLISFFGLGIRAVTIGHTPAKTSGRNTRAQVAGRLNTTGIYSLLRHPLYLGNYFMILGVMSFAHNVWVIIVYTLLFTLYYERIMYAEEAFLKRKFGEEYLNWANQTPAFFPRFSAYKASELPFSFRNVLRREYSGFFAVIASMFILEVYGDLIIYNKLTLDIPWLIALGIGAVIYLSLRTIRKKTRWLKVEGR